MTNLNLKSLSDQALLDQTEALVQRERKTTLEILQHLREIEIRRLFVDLGFSSMYDYCLRQLKYSEGEVQRRLSSARLLTDLPEIEAKIQAGDLNITSLAKIQSFVRAEKACNHELTKEDKLELITHLQNKSTRQVEQALISYSHQPTLMAEKFHQSPQINELSLENSSQGPYTKFEALLNPYTQALVEEFKNLYAHELQDHSHQGILKLLLEKALQAKKKKLGLIAIKPKTKAQGTHNASLPSSSQVKPKSEIKLEVLRKPLKLAIKKQLWQRAQGCCEHRDPKTKTRCTSKFALEIDHIQPLALQFTNELDNLQLFCRSHNSRRAIKTFGSP